MEINMAIDKVREYFKTYQMDDHILEFDVSSATVELAAEALHCEGKRIAKTMSFLIGDQPMLIVTAGDTKIDNAKYKHFFGAKAKMIPGDEVERIIGHAIGGGCPLAVKDNMKEKINSLTKRELEVLIEVANGMFNKEIASSLNISERTVKNHISNIFKKIDVSDRTQAAVFAIKNNLIKLY